MCSFSLFTFAVTALLTLTYITPVLSAPSGVCGSGLYKAFLVLSAYPAAESYCTEHYPLAPSTSTITGATSSFTVTATKTTESDVYVTSTATAVTATAFTTTTVYMTTTATAVTSTLPVVTVTAPTVPTTTTVSTTTITSTGAMKIRRTNLPRDPATSTSTAAKTTTKASGVAAVWASVESQAASFVKTLCSCIETTPTVKQTIFPSVTKTLTATTTSTSTSTNIVTPTTTSTLTVTITLGTTVTPTVTSAPSTTVTPTTTISVTATVTTIVRPAATYHLDFSGLCCYNHYDTFPALPGNPDEATGIMECQALCDQNSACNVAALVNYNTFSACAMDSAPYDSSYVQSPCYGYCDVYTRVPI